VVYESHKLCGLNGNFTNHSGKRTFATLLNAADVDKQEIMKRTVFRFEQLIHSSFFFLNYRNLLIVHFVYFIKIINFSYLFQFDVSVQGLVYNNCRYSQLLYSSDVIYKLHPMYITHCIYFTVYLTSKENTQLILQACFTTKLEKVLHCYYYIYV